MPASRDRRALPSRALTRVADLLGAVAMGILLAVLMLGLALDGSPDER